MSLPLATLTWYRMPDATPASANIQGLLDAIYTAASSTTDYRGTSLASSHLWTVARQQSAGVTKAVYLTPPSGTGMGLSPGLIVAGDSGAPTPTMASPDSYTASNVLVGIVKNRGAWNAWDAANPFTSGTFSGYWRAAGTAWNATSATVRVYISEESIFVQLIGATTTTQAWFQLGALVEPHATYSESTHLDCESDDRLYGMWATGGGQSLLASWSSSVGTGGAPFDHGTLAGNEHFMVFQPDGSTLYGCGRRWLAHDAVSTAQTTTASGRYVADGMPIGRSTASRSNDGTRLGVLRGPCPIGKMQSGKTLRNGSTDLYHVVSRDTAAVSDAFVLKAAA